MKNNQKKHNRMYDSVRWRKARAAFLSANPLCSLCALRGIDTPATIVDHKEPHKGSYEKFWDRDNWQGVCVVCHSGIKAIEERHGYSQSCDASGYPLDAKHPFNKR